MSSLEGHSQGARALGRWREAEGAGFVQPQEETVLRGPNSGILPPVATPSREWSLALLSGAVWETSRQQAEAGTREVHSGCEENTFHHEDTQIPEQVIQGRS